MSKAEILEELAKRLEELDFLRNSFFAGSPERVVLDEQRKRFVKKRKIFSQVDFVENSTQYQEFSKKVTEANDRLRWVSVDSERVSEAIAAASVLLTSLEELTLAVVFRREGI